MVSNKFTQLFFNQQKYGISFTISGFVYIVFSHFYHFGILKNSTIYLPISILFGSLQSEFNRALLHCFGFVYISSHICSHIWKLYKITSLQSCSIKLSENVYMCYTQIKSQVTNKLQKYVGPRTVQIWTENSPKWAGLDFFRTVNLSFPKQGHKKSFYTDNQQNWAKLTVWKI